jgi:arylsulfatase B
MMRNDKVIEEKRYLTDAFTDEAIQFIEREKKQPFFLFLSYNAVHSPLQGADAYMKKMSHIEDIHRRVFAAMLTNLDDSVGAVLGKIRGVGLEENTLIFFLSDNGGPTKELTSSNSPLRGGKGQMYEGGIRVPFMAQWKGTIPAGQVYKKPVVSLDIHATAAALASKPLSPERADGVNLIPFLDGKNTAVPHEQLFWSYRNNAALRQGDWKLLRTRGKWQLYNLAQDLAEENDLSKQEAETFRKMKKDWDRLRKTMPEYKGK